MGPQWLGAFEVVERGLEAHELPPRNPKIEHGTTMV
jgi:hypothetical protein